PSPMLNTTGIRIATPLDGPRPGSAPIMVPRKQPTKASSRFCQVSATAKPSARRLRLSISNSCSWGSEAPGALGQVQSQQEMEDQVDAHRDGEAADDGLARLAAQAPHQKG